MSIKVAYDISNLAADYGRSDAMTGINRVVSELLDELSKRDDLAMTAVALEGEDPLDDCTKAALYLEHRTPPVTCGFEYTFDPGWGLTTVYKAVLQATREAAVNQVPMNQPRTRALRYARSALHRLAHYHRKVSPKPVLHRKSFDVFHCPHWKLPSTQLMSGLPRVFTVYDLIPIVRPEFVEEYLPAVFQRQLNRIDIENDWVLCISEFTRQEFCDRTGMAPDRVRVSPLAAADVFHPVTDPDVIGITRARYRVPEGEYLLCLAAPQPRKNVAHLIRSFLRLLDEQQLPDVHLVLAGSPGQGWMYDEIFAAAKTSSHRARFIFAGYVAEEDLAALYSGAVAFVFPSLYEGFGLPALEAMACGTPVITSDTTSLPEVVGDAALLVDPTDPVELCDAMDTMLTNHLLRQELRRKGLTRAAQFSWTRCADQTTAMYHLAAAGVETTVSA